MTNATLMDDEMEFAGDVARARDVLARYGKRLSSSDVAQLWRAHSVSLCAQWMQLPPDDEVLYRVLLSHMRHSLQP